MLGRPNLTFFCELEAAPLQALFSLPDIAVLADLKAGISMGLLDFAPQRAEIVRRLNTAGIPVTAWLLLPKEQGYWFNSGNSPQAVEQYRAFHSWSQRENLQWAGVGLDIEPDVRDFELAARQKWRLIPLAALRLLKGRRVRKSRRTYQNLVDEIRRDGYRVDSYQHALIVDERLARSNLLQKVAGLVDLRTDREVLMLYSSFFRPHGAGMIWSYGSQAGSIGIGSTGGGVELGGIEQPPLSWQEFARDLRLAYVFSSDIHIFSLEGCLKQGYLTRLKNFAWDQPIIDPVEQGLRISRLRASLRSFLWLGSHPVLIWGGLLAVAASLRLRRLL